MSLVCLYQHNDFIILSEDTQISGMSNSSFDVSKNYFESKLFLADNYAIACYGNFGNRHFKQKGEFINIQEEFENKNFKLRLIQDFVNAYKSASFSEAKTMLIEMIKKHTSNRLKCISTSYVICGIEMNEFYSFLIEQADFVSVKKIEGNLFISPPTDDEELCSDLRFKLEKAIFSLEGNNDINKYLNELTNFYEKIIRDKNYPTVGGKLEYITFFRK